MIKGLIKSIRLEFNHMMEAKFSFLFYLIVPSIVVAIFASITGSIALYPGMTVYQYFSTRIIALVLIFVTVQLTILRIIGERAPYGTLDRDLLAISRSSMYFGKIIANSLFVLTQSILIYITAFVIFKQGSVYANPLILILLIFLVGLFGLALGLTISIVSRNREQAIQMVPFAILIMLTLSDFFFVERFGVPENVKEIASYSPLSISYKMIQTSTSDIYGFTDMVIGSFQENHFLKMVLLIGILLIIGLLWFNLEKRK